MIMGLINHRIRGFRTLNIVFSVTLLVLAVGVNLAKTLAGRERNAISQVENGIRDERQRIRVLEAEVAHLEQPERLERLSRVYLAMAPIQAAQESTVDALPDVAGHAPQPQKVSTESVAVP